jgi:phytoene desaturase
MKRVVIAGAGFSGLSAACYLAKAGYDVVVLEKNDTIGGRARQLKRDGFTFDMGPTFYWMPDIFEKFFADFSHKSSDFYKLVRLDPGYSIFFGKGNSIDVTSNFDELCRQFESRERGSSEFLKKFTEEGEFNYRVAVDKVIYKPGLSPTELVMLETISRLHQFLSSISRGIRRAIKSPELISTLEFPVLFLGAMPQDTPYFYNFMNYADIKLGTWHIEGGFYKLAEAMADIARNLGAEIRCSECITKIEIENKRAKHLTLKSGEVVEFDTILFSSDYHHSELLIDEQYRNYSEDYWRHRVFAPSALMFYVGFSEKLKNLKHHSLFFDTDFNTHAHSIYKDAKWPAKPLFYASFPSMSDGSLAPEGKECGIFLIPVAPGLNDSNIDKGQYLSEILSRIESVTGESVSSKVLFSEAYSVSDFARDYNAYKGNAYGLSNILTQTAFLKPKLYNKKIDNIFYCGQLTVPGPGVPPSLISGKIVSELIIKKKEHGSIV